MESKQLFITGHVALFMMLELILYVAGEQRAMILTAIVFGIFAIIFFLYSSIKSDSSFISIISEAFKPPHQRVKKIVVGNQEAPNNTVIRIKKETEKISNTESSRNYNRNSNSSQTNTSCIIPIVDNPNRAH